MQLPFETVVLSKIQYTTIQKGKCRCEVPQTLIVPLQLKFTYFNCKARPCTINYAKVLLYRMSTCNAVFMESIFKFVTS